MKSYEPVEVVIDHLEPDGCGYPADGRQAVFGALQGETLRAVPIARKHRRLYLRATDVIKGSVQRVTPVCGAADYCGGCSFQHMDHQAQLAFKQAHLASQLSPLAPNDWLAPVQSAPYHYRSKARLGVKFVHKKGRVLVGFRETMKPYIADTGSCPVLVQPVADLIEPLAELVAGLSRPDCVPQIELASGDDEVALVFRHLNPLAGSDISSLREFGERRGLQIYLQPGGIHTTHRIWPDEITELLTYRLPDLSLEYRFSAQDFTQVNLGVNRDMVTLVLELLALSPTDRVMDAFCGIGNFSLAIARFAGQVIGAESAASSIDRARDNARLNDLANVRFEVMDLHEKTLNINNLGQFDKVLLDPPRSGAQALSKVLASSDVGRVVYVSCNPSSLARDVKILVEHGFELRTAGIIDMFPHTTHVESVVLLVRAEAIGSL